MKKQVERLAHQTLKKLTHQLLESPRASSLTKDEIIQIITDTIHNDYISCRKSQRQDFYKKLSHLLHPDRFSRDLEYRNLAVYLNERELLEEPQKILNEHYKGESVETYFTFFKDVFSNPSQSLDILRRRAPDNPLVKNIQRYNAPIKLGVIILLAVSLLASGVIAVLSSLASTITRSLINAANNLINHGLNKITENRYEQMAELYKEANFLQYKKQFLIKSKITIQSEMLMSNYELYSAINSMDDSEFWDYLLTIEPINEATVNTAEELVHEKIKKSAVFSIDKIKSAFFALYETGTDVNKGLSQRAMLLITSPFVLTALVLGETVSLAQHWFFAALDAANVVSSYVVFTVLNAPLISYDVSVSLLEYLLDKDIVDHEVSATEVHKTPLYLLFDKPVDSVSLSSSEVEPIHMGSPIQGTLVQETSVSVQTDDRLTVSL